MIRLNPAPEVRHDCPYCQAPLEVSDWYMPGMRMLADLLCPQCKQEFYGDLPVGHGLDYPMLLEKESGAVIDQHGADWFAQWLRDSYLDRSQARIPFHVKNFQTVEKPLLLNCLDTLYGHCLLKLLNAQYYLDQCPDFDLIVLVPTFLRWMVPDGVAAIWTVDVPLREGKQWNDWLAEEIKRRLAPFEECWLSVAFSHPHPEDFNIERFTNVAPFPMEAWRERLATPTITFIWREDRLWADTKIFGTRVHLEYILRRKLKRRPDPVEIQIQAITKLGERLRTSFPTLDFAVAGMGDSGAFPDWITDLRQREIDEATERSWCRRYARSHVVVGIHGSNMLLPSAHAGAVIDLMLPNRWGNIFQDILSLEQDIRAAAVRYRCVPLETPVATLAKIAATILRYTPNALRNFTRPWCDHKEFAFSPKSYRPTYKERASAHDPARLLNVNSDE